MAMTNVNFNCGASTNLPSTGVDGSFYYTTDENRLHIGYNGTIKPLTHNERSEIITIDGTWDSVTNENNVTYYKKDIQVATLTENSTVMIDVVLDIEDPDILEGKYSAILSDWYHVLTAQVSAGSLRLIRTNEPSGISYDIKLLIID